MTGRGRLSLVFEHLLFSAGLILLLVDASAMLHRAALSRLALRDFDTAQAALSHTTSTASNKLPSDAKTNFGDWSKERIRSYKDSLLVKRDLPIAVLHFVKLHTRMPVFEGTDELALNRGVGWIAGTARPGDEGNIGIAGHRDGFFRVLKEISVGDAIELLIAGGKAKYTIDQVEIVEPDNVGVLRPRGLPSLTLVTCYPFYFVGSAPLRFVVHAALKKQVGASSLKTVPNQHEPKHFEDKEKGK
jgi:sortase A